MSWKEELAEKLSTLSKAEFKYIETDDISRVSEIDLNCSGIYMEATIIFFEIKNWSFLLKEHGRRKVAQVYTMYNEVLSAIAKQTGAFVNCLSPNSFLIVYPGKDDYAPAIKGAMKIAQALSDTFKADFANINGLEFSMGMDHGHIMGTKCMSDNNMEHLSWFGNCIHKAHRISNECSRPFYIGVSSGIYHNLSEELRITSRRILGIKKSVEIWTKVSYQYENVKKHLYQTNKKLPIDDES
jgi:class 3 adenylate cyclase